MTAKRRNRLAFALLAPSLTVPIAAMALAAWRMQHVDDDRIYQHVGLAPFYFGAMITLAAVVFSMSLNVVLAIRNHASLPQRAIALRRVAPHYAGAAIVVTWAVEFCVLDLELEGLIFGIILVLGSMVSLVVISTGRIRQDPIAATALAPRRRALLAAHPILVALTLTVVAFTLPAENEVFLIAIAVLGILGLPWSGFTVMLWLPVTVVTFALGSLPNLAVIFALIAASPAVANAALSVLLLRSTERRTRFVNDFLEAQPTARADSNSLGT